MIFLIVLAVAVAVCIYSIATVNMPSLASIRQFGKILAGTAGKKMAWDDKLFLPLATRLSKFIHMEPVSREALQNDLHTARMHFSPEEYILLAWLKSIPFWLIGALLCLYNPLVGIVLMVPGCIEYYQARVRATTATTKKRRRIEARMPQFVRYVKNAVAGRSQSVVLVTLIENYLPTSGKTLRGELQILLADMRTITDDIKSSHELALKRFAARVNSDIVTRVVFGLIDLDTGKDVSGYFQGLQNELRSWKNAQLTIIADKRPAELFVTNAVLFVGIILTVVVMVFGFFNGAAAMFGL